VSVLTSNILNLSNLNTLAEKLSRQLKAGDVCFLHGELGAGKTTFVQKLLESYGLKGKVKSPTYGLLESYELEKFTLHHMDLYRLKDPEELIYLGLDDLFKAPSVFLVEWPEKACGSFPTPPTYQLYFYHVLENPDVRRYAGF